jgi:hypothetical protein
LDVSLGETTYFNWHCGTVKCVMSSHHLSATKTLHVKKMRLCGEEPKEGSLGYNLGAGYLGVTVE